MAKNDIDYTLLEIIEGPKRINNITHERLFDYLLEATESQDRFETFLQALEYNAWWAYLGFMLMASDMIPITSLFEEEFSKELVEVKHTRGSTNEHAVFNMLMSYFDRGILTEKKHRTYLIRYMSETLSTDEYEFCITCLRQKYKTEVFPFIQKMYENGKLNNRVHEFFSFAMCHNFDKEDRFTNICLPVWSYKKYVKVGNTIFYEGKLLDKRIAKPVLEFIRVTSLPGRHKQFIEYPMICEVYVETDVEPFMIVTTKKGFLTKSPISFDDTKFIELFYKGYENFICSNGERVVSFISKDNGFVSTEELKCKSIKKLKMPLLILGVGIEFLLCKLEDGNEITVFLPSNLANETFKSGDVIEVAKYSSTYYFRGKKEYEV